VLVYSPNNKVLVYNPNNKVLVYSPNNKVLVYSPNNKVLVYSPNNKVLVSFLIATLEHILSPKKKQRPGWYSFQRPFTL
jgi:uncharacterized protein with WD repeat